MQLREIEAELNRLGYGLSYDNLIINHMGRITEVMVQLSGDRIKFIYNEMGSHTCSYPAKIESISKFLDSSWYANWRSKA